MARFLHCFRSRLVVTNEGDDRQSTIHHGQRETLNNTAASSQTICLVLLLDSTPPVLQNNASLSVYDYAQTLTVPSQLPVLRAEPAAFTSRQGTFRSWAFVIENAGVVVDFRVS